MIGYDQYVNKNPLCPYNDFEYPYWYWYSNFGVLGAYILIWIALIIKIVQIESALEKTPHLVAFHIVSIGMVATALALFLDWGGVCIDRLGYLFTRQNNVITFNFKL